MEKIEIYTSKGWVSLDNRDLDEALRGDNEHRCMGCGEVSDQVVSGGYDEHGQEILWLMCDGCNEWGNKVVARAGLNYWLI